jgi:hypothetical protein
MEQPLRQPYIAPECEIIRLAPEGMLASSSGGGLEDLHYENL